MLKKLHLIAYPCTCTHFLTCLIIQTFYNAAFRKVQRVTERYRKVEEVYAQVCTLFGENPRVVEPSDFFKTFIDFIANFKVLEYQRMTFMFSYATDVCDKFKWLKGICESVITAQHESSRT